VLEERGSSRVGFIRVVEAATAHKTMVRTVVLSVAFFLLLFAPFGLGSRQTLHDAVFLGTHNSYHVRPSKWIPQWRYSFPDLASQLGDMGVRHVELDLRCDRQATGEARLPVYHFAGYDDRSTCKNFAECVRVLEGWHDRNPNHGLVTLFLEATDFDAACAQEVDRAVGASFNSTELLVPNDLRTANLTTLEAVLIAKGPAMWPDAADIRGKFLVAVEDLNYVYDPSYAANPAAFLFGPSPASNVVILKADPRDNRAEYAARVQEGYLLRVWLEADFWTPICGETETNWTDDAIAKLYFELFDLNGDGNLTRDEIYAGAALFGVSRLQADGLALVCCGGCSSTADPALFTCANQLARALGKPLWKSPISKAEVESLLDDALNSFHAHFISTNFPAPVCERRRSAGDYFVGVQAGGRPIWCNALAPASCNPELFENTTSVDFSTAVMFAPCPSECGPEPTTGSATTGSLTTERPAITSEESTGSTELSVAAIVGFALMGILLLCVGGMGIVFLSRSADRSDPERVAG
jgi:Phosphoinositide phospholipase C, Ca2+-dependent